MTEDGDLLAVMAVLADVQPTVTADRSTRGRIVLRSVNAAGSARFTTTLSGDPHDTANVLRNVAQHVTVAAASDALANLTHRGQLVHDTDLDGEPHVVIPPPTTDYRQNAARAEMLSKRRSREAHGGAAIAHPHDAELDAMDEVLSSVTFTWPGATVGGLWAERWTNGALVIASDLGRQNSTTGQRLPAKPPYAESYFSSCTPFRGDPFNRDEVLAAAARHIAWTAAHESLEHATVDDESLYNPHVRGEVRVHLSGCDA